MRWLQVTMIVAASGLVAPRTRRISSLQAAQQENARPAPDAARPWPEMIQIPLPAKLLGGLFLFAGSVPRRDRALADEILALAQIALNNDQAVTSELGYGLEARDVYASAADGDDETGRRLVLEFQIQGGNLWAQGTARGVRSAAGAGELRELYVTNMDGAMMGDGGARVRLDV